MRTSLFNISITIILLFSCFFSNITAQSIFKAGAIIGLNMAQIEGDEASGFNQVGLNTGILGNVILHKQWEVGFELLFSQKGSRAMGDENTPSLNYRLNYC